MSDGAHPIQSLYLCMIGMGLDPNRLAPNHADPESGGRVMVGFPDTSVGLHTEGDTPEPFRDSGWALFSLSQADLSAFAKVYRTLQGVTFEDARRRSMETVKTTSKDEQVLVDEVLRRGLPEPDRNLRLTRDDGRELTTPDLAWEAERIAVFVDGLWWHRIRDDAEMIEALNLQDEQNRAAVLGDSKVRAERDAKVRAELTTLGWAVLSCTDRQLADPDHVTHLVGQIEHLLGDRAEERRLAARRRREGGSNLSRLLN